MKARGGRFLLILGAALAAMAFVVVYVLMSGGVNLSRQAAEPAIPVAPAKVNVAVVKADVAAYTMLDATNVTLMEVEATTALADSTNDPQSVYGKMTLVPLSKEQQVQKGTLADSGFSNVLAKGERAFALAVPERSTFGNAITVNDRVDILWTGAFNRYNEVPGVAAEGAKTYEKSNSYSTKTLLQDIHVLRVLNLRTPPPPPADGSAEPASANSAANTATVVTATALYMDNAPYQAVLILGMTDQQAEVLQFARTTGVIDLTLRSSSLQKDAEGKVVQVDGKDVRGDSEIEKTTGINMDILIKEYGIPCDCPQP